MPALHRFLEDSARRHPERVAVEEPSAATITYRDLDLLADRLRDRLCALGVRPGDRVGIYLRKSIDAVAAIFGILKSGAAYVPVDPGAPVSRGAYVLTDCAVTAAVIEDRFEERLRAEMVQLGGTPELVVLRGTGGGAPLAEALDDLERRHPASQTRTVPSDSDDLAYILYTSGSTGRPKGVVLSHRNAVSFVDWCSEAFQPTAEDRFSSHAPLHFDLSILDLHLAIKHGAAVVLIGEDLGKDAPRLGQLIAGARLSVWYSAPSILSLLAQYGNLDRHDYSALRLVLFAGEVFPIKHLRALKALLPHPRYFNLYGPTETNVCTFYEVPAEIPADRTVPFPIGKACSHLQTKVAGLDGQEVAPGAEGELCVRGPAVTSGYWNLPEQSAASFLEDPTGERWYKTGDLVVEDTEGNYLYLGRRDRMVKRRGYRVELGEIEAALYRHPEVKEAAAVAFTDDADGVRIKAFLSCRGTKPPSLIELKRFCSEHLPLYMVPDLFAFSESLPKTSTGKTDYQRLKEMG
jgi:amino acid adenylation domain-containing protein